MKKLLAAGMVAVSLASGAPAAARATPPDNAGPSAQCYGQIVAGIASTWPWAHDAKIAFQPPPGAVALWIREFGPAAGVSSVRELQLMFCAGA